MHKQRELHFYFCLQFSSHKNNFTGTAYMLAGMCLNKRLLFANCTKYIFCNYTEGTVLLQMWRLCAL